MLHGISTPACARPEQTQRGAVIRGGHALAVGIVPPLLLTVDHRALETDDTLPAAERERLLAAPPTRAQSANADAMDN